MIPFTFRQKIASELNYNLLIFTSIFYILGIIGQKWFALLIYSVLIILFTLLESIQSRIHLFILALFLAFGHSNYQQATTLPDSPEHIYFHFNKPQEVVITGSLAKMITFDGYFSRLLMETEYISFRNSPRTLHHTKGTVSLSVKGPIATRYVPGQQLVIRAKVKRPQSFIGKGVFDYARFLAEKKLWVTGFIASPLHIHKLSDQAPRQWFTQFRYTIESYRDFIGRFLDQTTPHAGLYRALLLGDKSQLSLKTLQYFQQCGLAHILAISGLHIAVLSSAIYFSILTLLKRSTTLLLHINVYKLSLALTLPIIIFYALLTGLEAPVCRALLMFVLIVFAVCIERVKSPFVLIAASALILLSIDPRLLFQASFLLSYAAIIGITLSFPLIERLTKKSQQYPFNRSFKVIIAMFVVSVAASLATLPISLSFFNKTSLIGPIANILIEPLICLFTLPLGFLSLCSLPFSQTAAQLFLDFGALGIVLTQHIVDFAAQLPFSHRWLPQPPLLITASFYLSFLLLFHCFYKKRKVSIPLILLMISMFFMWKSPYEIGKRWLTQNQVHILDVGKGSANLIELSGGHRVLIDAGGPQFTKGSIAERVIAPYLWSSGIQNLDAIYLTHGDADHYNGVRFIIKHFSVPKLYIAHKKYYSEEFRDFVADVESSGIKVEEMLRGEEHRYGQAKLQCLENFTMVQSQTHMRNKGIVLRLEQQGQSILFPGDIHSEEENLIALHPDIQSTILLASHHGSKTSSSATFLKAVQPSAIIISANTDSPYFPAAIVTSRYQEHNLPYFSTARHGSLRISINEGGFRGYGVPHRTTNPYQQQTNMELFSKVL